MRNELNLLTKIFEFSPQEQILLFNKNLNFCAKIFYFCFCTSLHHFNVIILVTRFKVFLVKYISTKVLKILMFTTLNSALSLLSRILSFIPLETPRDLY